MIEIQEYIHCYENVLNLDICNDIINNSENLNFRKATTFKNSNDRKCYVELLDKKYETILYNAVGTVIQKYADDHKWFMTGASTDDTGYEHLIYVGSENGEYKTHVDHFDLHPRVLSCSFILNEEYDGGDFSFFEGKHIVKKKAGSAVVFPSNFCFPHAVTPVTNGDRHAVITWIH